MRKITPRYYDEIVKAIIAEQYENGRLTINMYELGIMLLKIRDKLFNDKPTDE